MRRIRKLAVVLSILSAQLVLTAALAVMTASAQDPDTGQARWAEYGCKNCHGESGEGVWAGPLAGSDKTAEQWISQVRAPFRRMPAFSEAQISDQTILDMHAFLSSLERPADFAIAEADLPADAHAGQLLVVEKKCVGCHGTAGPIGGFTARGETPTTEIVLTQLRTPRGNMPMFSTDQVSDQEAATITEFLVSQLSPPSLPQTGGLGSSIWLIALPIVGAGLVLSGYALRRQKARS